MLPAYYTTTVLAYTVEPPLKETPKKGNLSIMNRITCPKSYAIQRFHYTALILLIMNYCHQSCEPTYIRV